MDAPASPHALTLSDLLRRLAAERASSEALVYPAFAHGGQELRYDFAALDARVDDLARGLIAAGIQPGEHVAVWAPNVPDWVPLEFALARVGAVLVTVNTALQPDEVAYVLRQSKAVAVLAATRAGSNEIARTLSELATDPALAAVRLHVHLPATPDEPTPDGATPLSELVERGRSEVDDATLAAREAAGDPDDVVNIQYTSGTTGFPKGVMLSHRNILINAQQLGDQIRMTEVDRVAMVVPLFHCFGCVVCVLGAFTHGCALCAIPAFEPEAALRLVSEERCTVLHGVPTMFSAMLDHPARARYDTTSLRSGLAAGAPVPEPLMHRIIDELHCAGMCIAYGLTEAAPGVAGSNPEDPVDLRCGTLGRALPGVEVRVVAPGALTPLPPGEPGELLVRGPNVMVGYHDDEDATGAAVQDGWLRTGDQCTLDEGGLLRIAGRIKDLVIRGGENIAPAEIENVLRGHPGIADVAVFGVPDDFFGEEVAAAVVVREGARFDPDGYAAHLEGHVASFKRPKAWHQVDAFPLTGSGKVRKFLLRERFGGDPA